MTFHYGLEVQRRKRPRIQKANTQRVRATKRLHTIRGQRIRNRRAVVLITAVAFLFCVVLGVQMLQKYKTLSELKEQEAGLHKQYREEQDLSQELRDKEAYVKTDEYIEEMARRLGLLYPNEIIFKTDK